MKANGMRLIGAAVAMAVTAGGCGEVARNGRSPVQLVVTRLEASSGAQPGEFGGTLHSDVITVVQRSVDGTEMRIPTVFSDTAEVTMRLVLRDPGIPGVEAAPSPLNDVTINRYRVIYRRSDGRNQPGVDVPFPFDSAVTFTVTGGAEMTANFEIVRHIAKSEAPLLALGSNGVNISTIGEITFYGRDQAGNDVSVSAQIGIVFANFGDPE